MNTKSLLVRLLVVFCLTLLIFTIYKIYKKTEIASPKSSTEEIIKPEIIPTEKESTEKPLIQTIETFAELEQKISATVTPIIIKCFGSWCPPCKAMKPIYEQFAQEFHEKFLFYEIDVDRFDKMQKLNVRGIPVFLLYKDGKEINRIVGARTYKELSDEILKAL